MKKIQVEGHSLIGCNIEYSIIFKANIREVFYAEKNENYRECTTGYCNDSF